jgi:hypothetical protein
MATFRKSVGLEPATSIIRKLGGIEAVIEITGCGATTPYTWTYPKSKNGSGGLIPQRYHPAMLDYARRHGIDLRAEDFLPVKGGKAA